MASIFLSYAHEDHHRVAKIAPALEEAGHSVWWDRRIHAGSRFSAEIDRALKSAELVVVLWSRVSIESAWVHDEAAAGRDSGRLVPVLIDRVELPLGFRQYQTIDLSRGLRNARAMQPLLDGIRNKLSNEPLSTASSRPAHRFRVGWKGLAALAALVLMLVGGWYASTKVAGSRQNSVAIAASGGDPNRSSELARAVALDLGRYRTGPLSRLSIMQSTDPAGANATYRVDVAVTGIPQETRADISLRTRSSAGLLWTTSIEAQGNDLVDIRLQAASAIASVLDCVAEVQASKSKLDEEALGLYLTGCGMFHDINEFETSEEVLSVFRKLTEKAPDFAPGWADLAYLQLRAWPGIAPNEQASVVRTARIQVKNAQNIEPNLPQVIAAEASLPENWLRPAQAQALIDRGLKLHPDSALLHGLRAESLGMVGRDNDSIDAALKALQLNPLSPSNHTRYISALAYAGRTAKSFDELRKAEAIWPGSAVLRQARYRLNLRYGDPEIALHLLRQRGSGDARPMPDDVAWEAFIEARRNPSAVNIEKALDAFRKRGGIGDWGYLQALGTFGKADEAFRIMQSAEAIDGLSATPDTFFRVHMRPILRDPRFMDVANRIGMLAYWKQTGNWPDFCRDPQLRYNCQAEAAKYPTQLALTRLGNGN